VTQVTPSAPLQQCNIRSRTQLARLWQQLHNFRHPIAKDDARRPASSDIKIGEVATLGCVPESATVTLLSSWSFAASSSVN
jgi:hypothetical protein